jgi:succinoglycan biosynthesis protein ExoA
LTKDSAQSNNRRVVVVLPTLNEEAHIERALSTLLQSHSLPNVIYVVADGGSTDRTVKIVRGIAVSHKSLYVINNPRRSQAAAVNLVAFGMGMDADILIRCDAHAEYPPDFIQNLISSLERSQAASVVVCMDTVGQSPIERALAWTCNSIVGNGGAAHRAGIVSGFVDHGHHAAFDAVAFRSVRGYDEAFSHNEDAELDCRLRETGYQIYLDANLRIKYYPRSSLRALARQYYAYGRGRMRTVRRHPNSLRLRQVLVPLNATLLLVSCLGLAVGHFVPRPFIYFLAAWPVTYTAVLLGAALCFSIRHRTAEGLLALPVAMTMHLSWAFGMIREAIFPRLILPVGPAPAGSAAVPSDGNR